MIFPDEHLLDWSSSALLGSLYNHVQMWACIPCEHYPSSILCDISPFQYYLGQIYIMHIGTQGEYQIWSSGFWGTFTCSSLILIELLCITVLYDFNISLIYITGFRISSLFVHMFISICRTGREVKFLWIRPWCIKYDNNTHIQWVRKVFRPPSIFTLCYLAAIC